MNRQFVFSMLFRADTAAGKAGLADLAGSMDKVSGAGEKAAAAARKQAADLQALAAATAGAIGRQDQLVAAEKRAQEARTRAIIAPQANPAATVAPMQAAFRATETAAGSLQAAVHGLTVTIGDQAQELVETANASRIYQSALDDIRATFNPLFAASRAYEQQLERIAEAEKIGAISAREAAAARVASAERLAPAVQPGAGRVSPWTANVGAQGFDIAVTAAMGMNPAMIGFQQGSQLAGIAQQMGGGAKAAKEMATGIMAIFNPTTLVIVGLTTLAAVGIQAFMGLSEKTKSWDDHLGDLDETLLRMKTNLERVNNVRLSDTFGTLTDDVRGLAQGLLELDRASELKSLQGVVSKFLGDALSPTVGQALGQGAQAWSAEALWGVDRGEATRALQEPLRAENYAAMGAANSLADFEARTAEIERLARAGDIKSVTSELLDLQKAMAGGGAVTQMSDDLISLLAGLAEAGIKTAEIEALWNGSARAEAQKRQVDQMVLGYQQEAELQAASLQFGSDAVELDRIRARHARDLLEIHLEDMGVERDSANWVRAVNALLDQQGEIEAGNAEARRERIRDQEDSIAGIHREISLIGASNAERLRANAIAEAEIEIRKRKLSGQDAELERARAIAKAEAEARRDREKALYDIGVQGRMDAFDARIAATRDPVTRVAIEAEKEYARVLADTGDAEQAAASAARVRTKAITELGQAQADFLRDQQEALQQLQLELALAGQSEAVRARVLALAQAERDVQRLGASGDTAETIRRNALAQADLTRELEKQADAWKRVQSAGETALDAVFDKLRAGDIGGAFEEMLAELESGLFDLAVRNPFKNALLGTNLGTLADVGGLQGIWARLTGQNPVDETALAKGAVSSVGTMSVTAASVSIGGPGAMSFLSGAANASGLPGSITTGPMPGSDVQAILRAVAVGGGARPDAISGLNGAFAAPLAAMVEEAERIFGDGAVRISSAYRSIGRQQQLWEEALRKYGSPEEARKWVAPPGSSRHNYGLAADLQYGSGDVQQWFHQSAGAYGLDFRMGNEPWHIEPRNAAAMMAGTNPAIKAAEVALTEFSGTATDATGDLGALGNGFNAFGMLLNNLFQGGSGGEGGGGLGAIVGLLGAALEIPGFASGGDHKGGWRIVGESGPELEATGSARIFSAAQTRDILTSRAPAMNAARQGDGFASAVTAVPPTINIHNYTSEPVRQETGTGPDGEQVIGLIVGRQISRGRYDKQLGARHGLSPEIARR